MATRLHEDVSFSPTDDNPQPNARETCNECWMPMPQGVPASCPSGLEYLTNVEQIAVHQIVEVIEEITGFETNNIYKIRNSQGQTMYSALEESTYITRQCCGNLRSFKMSLSTSQGTEVIRLVRPLRCNSIVCFCCLQELEVQSPPGVTVGWVKQNCSLLAPRFSVMNEYHQVLYRVNGPCFSCKWCDVEFQVVSMEDNDQIGTITKQWSALAKEYFSDADNFGIRFPSDLDVKMKAVLLGAVFLIDFMYFER